MANSTDRENGYMKLNIGRGATKEYEWKEMK